MEAQLRILIQKRGSVKARVTRFSNYLNSITNDSNIAELKLRLEKVKPAWEEFETAQDSIEELSQDDMDAQSQEREQFENAYFAALADAQRHIERMQPVIETQNNQQHATNIANGAQVKLPVINLPTFNGAYDQWMTFLDTFQSLIHNNNTISPIQKFHYLRSALTDEAAAVIHSLEVSSMNYELAWELLKERFQNKRIIVQGHVKALFEAPAISKDSHVALRQLLDSTSRHLRALRSLDQPVDSWDTIIIHLITTKFDQSTKREWETLIDPKELPKMADLFKFLQHRCYLLQSLNETASPNNKHTHSHNSGKVRNSDKRTDHKQREHQHSFAATNKGSCPKCAQAHSIYRCQEFINLPIFERIQTAKSLNLCLNCLRTNHKTNQCHSSACRVCSLKHHTMLHLSSGEREVPVQDGSMTHHVTQPDNGRVIMLSTAIIKVNDRLGNNHECRALLDSGSQSNFITTELAQKLKLPLHATNIPIMGVNQSAGQVRHLVRTTIRSRINDYEAKLTFLVLSTITERLPAENLEFNYRMPERIKLADPAFDKPAAIDMLIGAELFWDLVYIGQIKSTRDHPTLQKTHFGWIVSGSTISSDHVPVSSRCFLSNQLELQQQLNKFWDLEEFPPIKHFSPEEAECEAHFQATTTRDSEGRFVVRLPLIIDTRGFGESRNSAMKRLFSLERKLNKNPNLRKGYIQDLDDYISQGHMTLVPPEDSRSSNKPIFYLPHHAVIKDQSTTTKLRVVFDGSALTSNGTSLNDHLMVGPTIQDDLLSIIIRFRCHRYVITADIKKMYRQIRMHPDDCDLQRILWRTESTAPIDTYRLNTVTFGTATAPFLAVRCLHQLAFEESEEHPEVAKVITRDFYIDDLLSGAKTRAEVIAIKTDVTHVLSKAGLELHKWNSNCAELCESHTTPAVQITNQESIKTLGVYWNSADDNLSYVVKPNLQPNKCTKRYILSVIAGLFDPLGLLGPVVIEAKIMIQELWQIGSGWDEAVPMNLFTRWQNFESDLSSLNKIQIPRYVKSGEGNNEIHLHGFCDASERAYGACVYVRSKGKEDTYFCNLLCAKSRVAPLKTVTIPRLELCSAVLLAKLVNKVIHSLNENPNSITLWSDSTITLAWLSSSPHQWKIFVANRTSEIQRLTKECSWHHVRSQDNPADLLSRGISVKKIGPDNRLWWHGPDWLRSDKKLWPNTQNDSSLTRDLPEQRTNVLSFTATSKTADIFLRFSSLHRLVRVIAYCQRFIHNCRSTKNKQIGTLSCDELEGAHNRLNHVAQHEAFSDEIKMLKESKPLHHNSKLLSLSPFIDEEGLLRVGGRLHGATVSVDQRHPILLPSHHPFTTLIIRDVHIKQLHAGTLGTLAAVRLKFWPISGRRTTQGIIRACTKCFRASPRQQQPMMGQLPSYRVTPSRPFSSSGVDFAGPFFIHQGGPRSKANVKAYLAIFVCFVTRAVHLELVSSLSTEAFLATLKRFIGRRGKPKHVFSDNATNFTGVSNELKELKRKFALEHHQRIIATELAEVGIQWHFIPPASPHFGGLWEAAVKSAKRHLTRVAGDARLTFEEMTTLLIQVESCMNSRPITPLSADPNDLSALTPGHFLIGDALTAIAEPSLGDLRLNSLSRWQHVQKMTEHFWSRWSNEYLSILQQRHKWKTASEPLKVGVLVLIRDDRTPPLKWPLGRVMELHPGQDGVVRVVTIRTATGVLKRAATKLCVLPTEQ